MQLDYTALIINYFDGFFFLGKIRLCKSWRSWSSPELISLSPLAIVGGQETSLLVRGRNLTNPGTM